MWPDVILKERIETAIQEGLCSQALARERQRGWEKHAILHKLQQIIHRKRRQEYGNASRAVLIPKQEN